jgi:hypothetical protein
VSISETLLGWPLGNHERLAAGTWPRRALLDQPPPPCAFLSREGNLPAGATTAPGTSVTPAQNAYGNWQLLHTLAADCYMIEVVPANRATASSMLISIGVSVDGAANYQEIIPDLACYGPQWQSGYQATVWSFPLFIPQGSTIAARASINNATVGTVNVMVRCYGTPTRPDLYRYGSRVVPYTTNLAGSSGLVQILPGTNSGFSQWTKIGTTEDSHWYFECGMGSTSTGPINRTQVQHYSWGEYGGQNPLGTAYVGTNSVGIFWRWSPVNMIVPGGQGLWARISQGATSPPIMTPMLYGVR